MRLRPKANLFCLKAFHGNGHDARLRQGKGPLWFKKTTFHLGNNKR
jgi:hypothetical protein